MPDVPETNVEDNLVPFGARNILDNNVRPSWADSGEDDAIWLRRKALTWEQRVLQGADADSDHDSDTDPDMLEELGIARVDEVSTTATGVSGQQSGGHRPQVCDCRDASDHTEVRDDDLSRSDLGWAPVIDDGSPEEEYT